MPGHSLWHLGDDRRTSYVVSLLGKYLCYALLAVALDLVWGYCGILSLGHGAFFALGGYAMGMHLMREIGDRGVYANPILPDFMVFLNWEELPWYWYGFDMFWFAALMVLLVPGAAGLRLRLVRLPHPRHRRVSVDHHPGDDLCADAGLLPQRDGLRRQQRSDRLQGRARLRPAGGHHPRRAVRAVRASRWRVGLLVAKAITTSKLGKILIAIRDAESRTRFLGYRVEHYKLFVFVVSAMMAGVAGALYVPQVGIINPANSVPPTPSTSSSGWRSAGAARWSARPLARCWWGWRKTLFTGLSRSCGSSRWARCSSLSPSSCRKGVLGVIEGRRRDAAAAPTPPRARTRKDIPVAAHRHGKEAKA